MTPGYERLLWPKREAITTLLPYAVWQERHGRPEMLDTILRAVRASMELVFLWDHIIEFVSTLFSDASPRAVILVSPHLPQSWLTDGQDLVQQWIKIVPAAPHTDEVALGAVDTLLQIASYPGLLQHITPEAWSWLTPRPSLPPVCRGRYLGTRRCVVEAVRALKDIEVLKSYFLLVWSEWDCIEDDGLEEMYTSILEDFCGTGMGQHRADLIQRLGHVLKQLDHGLRYLKRQNPYIVEENFQRGKDQYRKLRETLRRVNTEAINRMPHLTMKTLRVLTHALNAYRISHDVHVCTPSPMSLVPA